MEDPFQTLEFEIQSRNDQIKIAKERYKDSIENAVRTYAQALRELYLQGKFNPSHERILTFWHAGYTNNIERRSAVHLLVDAQLKLVSYSFSSLSKVGNLEQSIEDFEPKNTRNFLDPITQLSTNEALLKELKRIYESI